MASRKRLGFFKLTVTGLFVSALLTGCGGSSDDDNIPTSIEVFNQHSVVLKGTGVLTAGYNAFGQLGDGTRTSRTTATPVNLGAMDGVAAGAAHTLAYNTNDPAGSVWAWGFNSNGQLGNAGVPIGTESNTKDYSATAVRVGALTKVSSVAAGAFHSLAVSDGKLFAWGGNAYGQLGNNTRDNARVPVELPAAGAFTNSNVVQVAAGALHSLALRDDGAGNKKVWAWGDNLYGQLGLDATATSSVVPVEVTFPDGAGEPVQIAAGGSFSLVLMRDGTVWAWGLNQYGQLGATTNMGTIVGVSTPTKLQILDPTTGDPLQIDQIAAGSAHVLALVDGKVWAWGFNERGQLGNNPVFGDGIDDSTATPVQVLLDATKSVTKIQAFGHSSLATVSAAGEVWGWGDNSYGQLGVPATESSDRRRRVPVQMTGY